MSTPFLAEIKVVSFNFAPKGWALCNGQLLPINQNQALFSLLGTTYGGNGTTTFALPNLQGRIPFHVGGGLSLGETGGETSHTLSPAELPAHGHPVVSSPNVASTGDPRNHYWAISAGGNFATAADTTMAPLASAGGSQPHQNMPPYLVLNFVIALQGVFPSRN